MWNWKTILCELDKIKKFCRLCKNNSHINLNKSLCVVKNCINIKKSNSKLCVIHYSNYKDLI